MRFTLPIILALAALCQAQAIPQLEAFDAKAIAEAKNPTQQPPANDADYREALRIIDSGESGPALVLLNIACSTGGHIADPVARTYRGRAFLIDNRSAEAVVEFNTALKLKPGFAAAVYWRGVALRRLGIMDQALEQIDQAIKAGYVNEDAPAIRAAILLRLGRYDEALSLRSAELAKHPDDTDERLYRAQVLAILGQTPQLQQELNILSRQAPASRQEIQASIDMYLATGQAHRSAEKETSADAAYAAANKLFWQARYIEAAEFYARAAQLKPDHFDALCGASASYELARIPSGHAWFAILAVRANPRNAEARTLLARAWRLAGSDDLAEGEFNAAIDIDPKYAPAYLGRGQLYYDSGNHNRQAQMDFNRAVELAPKDPQVWMARGIFLLEFATAFITTQGLSPDRAYNPPYLDFSKVIELEPRGTRAYVYRAITAAAWGKTTLAQADLKKAIDLEPWSAQANVAFANETLADMRAAAEMGRKMMRDFADGTITRVPPPPKRDDSAAAAARAQWNRDTAADNASRAGDHAAYERIRRDEATWRDRSLYGGL